MPATRPLLLPFGLGLALLAAHPAAAQTSYTFGGHTYFLTRIAESWSAAEAEAVADGGHLTAVTSAAENAFITTTFASGNLPLWLGGSDIIGGTQTHVYHWTTGEAFTYSNWYPGEPNDAGGSEDYATINWPFADGLTSDHSTWNDTPLNGSTGYGGTTNGPYFGVVEVAAPEPSQNAVLALGAAGVGLRALRVRRRGQGRLRLRPSRTAAARSC